MANNKIQIEVVTNLSPLLNHDTDEVSTLTTLRRVNYNSEHDRKWLLNHLLFALSSGKQVTLRPY